MANLKKLALFFQDAPTVTSFFKHFQSFLSIELELLFHEKRKEWLNDEVAVCLPVIHVRLVKKASLHFNPWPPIYRCDAVLFELWWIHVIIRYQVNFCLVHMLLEEEAWKMRVNSWPPHLTSVLLYQLSVWKFKVHSSGADQLWRSSLHF